MKTEYNQMRNKIIIPLIYTVSIVLLIVITLFNFNFVNIFQNSFRKSLINNGNFEYGLKGWMHDNVSIVDIKGTKNACLKNINHKRIGLRQNIDLISGKKYRLAFTLTGPQKGAYACYRNDDLKKEFYFWCNGINSNSTYNFEIVPEISGKHTVYLFAGREGEYYISNVSLRIIHNNYYYIIVLITIVFLVSLIAFLTFVFIKKWNNYLIHYLIGLTLILISLTNYDFTIISIVILSILLYLSSKIKWFYFFPLFIFIVLGFLKRIIFLGDKCFWWDEFLTEQRVWLSVGQMFKNMMTARCLLYSFILRFYALVINFFNNRTFLTEFQLRLPHAIVGTLALFIIYLIGKRFKDKVTGLLLVFLASFSSFLIYYAREARFYPFVLFFSACIIHSVVLIIYREKDCKHSKIILYYVYYSLAATCGMHTHQGFWLLFAGSNIFLAFFELTNFIFNSKTKKKDLLYIIPIFFLLSFPLITVYSSVETLLGNGADSSIIKAQKLVPSLDLSFFHNVHKELWSGLKIASIIHFIVLIAALIMLFFKHTRIMSIYFLMVMFLTFIALRNMGTFREPFRVKYITFMWLIESFTIIFALVQLFDWLFSKIKNYRFGNFSYCIILSFILIIVLSDSNKLFELPGKNTADETFRTIAQYINNNIKSNDIIVTSDAGYAALKYYNKVYSSNWKIILVEQIENKYKNIYDGFIYCLFSKNKFKTYDTNIFKKLTLDKGNYSLFKSVLPLDKSLQKNLVFALADGFKADKKLNIGNNTDRLYFGENYIVNGDFTNNFNGWHFSSAAKDNVFVRVISTNNFNFLNITNTYSKTIVLSQSFYIPTGGIYSLTYKTDGFCIGGHLSIKSNDVNFDIYRAEITNCQFTKFHNFKFNHPQKVVFNINIKPNDYANLYHFGFYKLNKQ